MGVIESVEFTDENVRRKMRVKLNQGSTLMRTKEGR